MAHMLFSQVAADAYKASTLAINAEPKKDRRAKSLRGVMKESFFHGASFHGSNFIPKLNLALCRTSQLGTVVVEEGTA